MTVLSHVIRRSVVPIGLSLAVIAVLLIALSAVPARATPDNLNLDRSQAPTSAPTAGPLQIPTGLAPSKIDGLCTADPVDGEWGDALAVQFNDYGGPAGGNVVTRTVYLKHDNTNLYVCMVGSLGFYPDRFASVYLDTLNTKQALAGPTDYALRVGILTAHAVECQRHRRAQRLHAHHPQRLDGCGYLPAIMIQPNMRSRSP